MKIFYNTIGMPALARPDNVRIELLAGPKTQKLERQ